MGISKSMFTNKAEKWLKAKMAELSRDLVSRYKKLENTIVFYNEAPIYISPEIAKIISPSLEKEIKQLGKDRYKKNRNRAYGQAEDDVHLEATSSLINVVSLVVDNVREIPKDTSLLFRTLRHEFGHIVTATKPLKETKYEDEFRADAFCAIETAKELGTRCALFTYFPYLRARKVIDASPVHCTSNSFFAVEKLAAKIDFNKVSDKEVVEFSRVICDKVKIDALELADIRDTFDKVSIDPEHPESSIVNIMKRYKDNEILYRAARLYLPVLGISVEKEYCSNTCLNMAETFKEIKEHEKATGFILNPIEAIEKKQNINFADEVIKEVKARIII